MDVCDYTLCNNWDFRESISHGNFESNRGTRWQGNPDERQLASLGFTMKIHKVGLFGKNCPLGFNIATLWVKYLRGSRMSAVGDSLVNIQVSVKGNRYGFLSQFVCANIHWMWNSNIRLYLKGHFPNQPNSQQWFMIYDKSKAEVRNGRGFLTLVFISSSFPTISYDDRKKKLWHEKQKCMEWPPAYPHRWGQRGTSTFLNLNRHALPCIGSI